MCVIAIPTSIGITENDTTRKRSNSLNDSEDGSPEPGSQSPTHTPPLTPALTPQREDTPAPENLSLRKSGSPQQTQQTLQPVDLVQPRPSPPLPSLAVSFLLYSFDESMSVRGISNVMFDVLRDDMSVNSYSNLYESVFIVKLNLYFLQFFYNISQANLISY